MDTLKKGYRCAYQTHYHIVFPVKYRKALLDPSVVETLKQTTEALSLRYELEVEQLGTDEDHIHLLLSFHPKYSIGQVVRLYKSITARELFSHPQH